MNSADVDRVLDCCDVVLASSSLRGHVVADEPTDAYWPALGVAAVVVEGRLSRGVRERLRRLDEAGIKTAALSVKLAAVGRETALRRIREAFDENPVPTLSQPLDPARARPLLLAILGAGALARRAAVAGDVLALASDELEALGVLAATDPDVAEEAPQVEGLAAVIARDAGALTDTLARLESQDLVQSVTSDHSLIESWVLTGRGRSAVAAWLDRCDGLLSGWPPSPPRDVDDVR